MSEQTPDIPHSHFTLEHLPPEERYDAWRDSISCIFTVESDSTASPLVAMLKDHIQSLHRQANYLDLATAESLTPATINLVAGCLNSSIEDLPLTHELDAMTEVRRVRHYIATNLSDPDLSPAIICSALGISRSRLYRIFSPYGGIAAYIRESRLHTAFQALIRSEQISLKLYEIAQSCGFRSNADFSRSFRKQYGLSPKEIRQKPGLLLRADNHSNIDRRYEQWLIRLTS